MKDYLAKKEKYVKILSEIEKFNDVNYGQRLDLIAKKLAMSKQNLNYYLKRFVNDGLILHDQEQPFSIYKITEKGRLVKENLVQSESGRKTVRWRYHNLIVGYTIFEWGNWKFNKRKIVRMNNWGYQIIKSKNGLQAHIQDTGLIKIYGPELYGEDGEVLRIKASTLVQDAVRWFINHYDFKVSEPRILRKGEKELLDSEQLAKVIGRIKTNEIYVNASGGDENLEEHDDSFAIEKTLKGMQETPERIDKLERLINNVVDNMSRMSEGMSTLGTEMTTYAKHMNSHIPMVQTATKLNVSTIQSQEITMRAQKKIIETMNAMIRKLNTDSNLHAHSNQADDAVCAAEAESDNPVEIKILRKTPRLEGKYLGKARVYHPMLPGAKNYVDQVTAEKLITEGYARHLVGWGKSQPMGRQGMPICPKCKHSDGIIFHGVTARQKTLDGRVDDNWNKINPTCKNCGTSFERGHKFERVGE